MVKGLDDGSENESLTLVSQEKEKFTVPKKVALQSELVKTMADGGKERLPRICIPNCAFV